MRTLAVWLIAVLCAAAPRAGFTAGLPQAYQPIVVRPSGLPQRAEFDLAVAIERARQERKRLYVYLGADDCRFCRRYEAFLEQHAVDLAPHFLSDYVVVDLRSALAIRADAVFIKVGSTSRRYADFQRWIGDERAHRLVYPNVWLLDSELKLLMQLPAGTGTFETVSEQIEVLRLQQ